MIHTESLDHPLPVNLEPFRHGISPEKRFIPCCRLARRLERFVGGSGQRRVQLINKSSVAEGRGWCRGLTRIKGREIRSVHRFISTAACRYLAKRSYTRVHTHTHEADYISLAIQTRERLTCPEWGTCRLWSRCSGPCWSSWTRSQSPALRSPIETNGRSTAPETRNLQHTHAEIYTPGRGSFTFFSYGRQSINKSAGYNLAWRICKQEDSRKRWKKRWKDRLL